jgi:hypothetical protein
VINGSPYIRAMKNKIIPLDPNYLHELEVLRAMVRQEDRQGNEGWGGSWTKERYKSLKEKHPEALRAFEMELRLEKEKEERRRETLRKYEHSPYIEELEGWPDSKEKDSYLKDLKRLRYLMIHSKLGYGSYPSGLAMTNLRNRYPQAYETLNKELRGLG